jgi:hypothetical protein
MHLNSEIALDFLELRLTKEQMMFWSQHLEQCNDCADIAARWAHLAGGLKRSHLMSASDEELERAMNIFRARTEAGPSRFQTVFAAIVFDSFLQPAMAGVRGTAPANARQLILRADEFDIHIRIWSKHGDRQMLGQLLPCKDNEFVRKAQFHLVQNKERIESTTSDETGEFHFTKVPAGELSLQIEMPHLTLVGTLNV